MSPVPRTPNSAIKLYRGVSIYQVKGSQNWYVRVWDSERKKYVVETTGVRTAIKAREIAKEFALELLKTKPAVDREFTFRHFAIKCLSQSSGLVEKGKRNSNYARTIKWAIQNEDWGLVRHFGPRDVRSLKTNDFRTYIENLGQSRPHLAASTKNTILAAFRNVLKIARDEGVIERVPDTPRTKQHDNPRPFFRFYPLVSKSDDAYKKVLETAKSMAKENVLVRGIPVTDELYDIILFLVHSFVRPIITELYAIRHSDITIAENPQRLIVVVRDGKTGFRAANTMPGAVPVYKRVQKRNPDAKGEDYIFLPQYENRKTAARIIQRQFHELLSRTGFDKDPTTQSPHTLYSLRHTAICMRIILSEGQVNIFNLAKNAGTSVDQIERFYARNLPLSREMAKNLQSFGSG
jgi:hypothetical protein